MIDAHDHHATPHAYGTSGHTHHRAVIEHDGIRVSFWTCAKSTATDHHCPDEPDPWVRWAEKVMERQATRRPAKPKRKPSTPTFGDPCRHGHASEHQRRNAQGSAYCLVCRREASRRSRMRKIADRIVTAAMAA